MLSKYFEIQKISGKNFFMADFKIMRIHRETILYFPIIGLPVASLLDMSIYVCGHAGASYLVADLN